MNRIAGNISKGDTEKGKKSILNELAKLMTIERNNIKH